MSPYISILKKKLGEAPLGPNVTPPVPTSSATIYDNPCDSSDHEEKN